MDARQPRWSLMALLRRRDDAGRTPAMRRASGPGRGHRGPVRTIAPSAVAIVALVGMTGVANSPALAAIPAVSIAVTSSPNPVSSGQALAYTITVANTGGATASGLSLTDSLVGVGIGSFHSSPWMTTSTGSCSYASPTVTCNVASLPAGQAWSVTITGQVTAAAGGSLSDTASVTGTESSTPFSASATVATPVNQVLPRGFTQTKLAGGLTKPILLAFAPNGDIYIGEQTGVILIYRNGAVLPTPLVTLPNVYYALETGLLGLALDPNFATNGYVYISWVVNVTKAGTTQPFTRLSRFTVVGNAIDLTTEKIYYQGNQAQNVHHPGQTVKVGPDGKLWWSVGDNVPSITNAQTLTNIYGKMLRFNLDGSVPSDNPFVNVPNAVPYIYAYGLRNPFRWTFLPNGQPMTQDTGSSYWEELDTIKPGGNYGWDFVEGACGSCGGINPVYAYGHYPVDGAASAVAAYTGSTFPQQYANVVFVGDYNKQSIDAITFDPTYQTVVSDTVFDSAAGTIADLEQGPDGNLYYTSIFSGAIFRISAPGPFAPSASASATPTAVPVSVPVQLSSAGSTDPYGLPLSYSWNFGDGSALSTAANPSHAYASAGTYTATLTVSNGSLSGTATTQVTVGASPPTATISAPATYSAGQAVAFSGTATDPVDGAEPPSAYAWKVDFYANGVAQPSYSAEVAHPFYGPMTGITSGSFQVPTDPSQTPTSFYRITLTVTDSLGLQSVVTQDLHPNTTTWTASANTAGAGYAIDGQWLTGPFSTTDVVGVQHVIAGMPLAQTIGGNRYRFAGFADGSALTDTITAGTGPGAYTANYEQVTQTMPAPWQSADVGAPITVGTADHAAGSQTFSLDGSGSDVFGANEQFHYVYQSLTGDGTIIARVRSQSNSSPWAKAGVMIAQSTAAGTPFVDALVTPDVSPIVPNINGVGCDANGCVSPLPPVTPAMGYGARMQYTSTGSVTPRTYPAGFSAPNKWVQLQRSGNTFTSWLSADGVSWTQIGIATLAMTGPVTIGLFDTAHNIGQYSTVGFDHVQVVGSTTTPPGPLPTGWADQDIGAPVIAGSGGYTSPTFTVSGAGADIFGASDQFNFASTSTASDGSLSARVTAQTNTNASAKAGVMFRATSDPGSPYYAALYTPGSGVVVQWRNSQGAATSQSSKVAAALPLYLRVTRSGTTFTAYTSSDAVAWTLVPGSQASPAVTGTMLAGLAVTSHNTTALSAATFDAVSLPSSPPPNDFSIGASPGSLSVAQGAAGGSSIGTALVSGSAESIALSISGAPTGVTAGFNPTSVTTGGSSSLTLTVGASVTPGTYPLTITGTAPSAIHTAPLSLTVTSASGGGLPSPWTDADIGAPALAGSATWTGGVFTVNGAGADIFGTADQFNFVSQALTGNGTLIARITSQANTSVSAKAGIMLRASSDPGSPCYAVLMTTTKGVATQWRTTQGNTTSQAAKVAGLPPLWLRITRSGTTSSTFTAFTSPDGAAWTPVPGSSQTIAAMPATVLAGMAVTSHNAGLRGSATFDTVSLVTGP